MVATGVSSAAFFSSALGFSSCSWAGFVSGSVVEIVFSGSGMASPQPSVAGADADVLMGASQPSVAGASSFLGSCSGSLAGSFSGSGFGWVLTGACEHVFSVQIDYFGVGCTRGDATYFRRLAQDLGSLVEVEAAGADAVFDEDEGAGAEEEGVSFEEPQPSLAAAAVAVVDGAFQASSLEAGAAEEAQVSFSVVDGLDAMLAHEPPASAVFVEVVEDVGLDWPHDAVGTAVEVGFGPRRGAPAPAPPAQETTRFNMFC